jgi:hypothetical protein
MHFSPIVQENTAPLFSWTSSIPGIFTGTHAFRFEEIPGDEGQENVRCRRTRFVQEERFTGLFSLMMGANFVGNSTGMREDAQRGLRGSVVISKLGLRRGRVEAKKWG